MFEPVYLVRGTLPLSAVIFAVPAKTGIVSLAGACHWFAPAIKDADGYYGQHPVDCPGVEVYSTTRGFDACRKKYGDIPGVGEAWLVQERKGYISWDREDQNMFLLNWDGSYHKEG